MAHSKSDGGNVVLASNRKAFHDYHIIERLEAGIQLVGTEVKSCRARSVTLTDGYAKVENGQVFLHNVHIAPYEHGNRFNHAAKQSRRLLLKRREILRLAEHVAEKGNTLVPLSFYLKGSLVKVELAVARGKTFSDKRDALRRSEDERAMRRAMRRHR